MSPADAHPTGEEETPLKPAEPTPDTTADGEQPGSAGTASPADTASVGNTGSAGNAGSVGDTASTDDTTPPDQAVSTNDAASTDDTASPGEAASPDEIASSDDAVPTDPPLPAGDATPTDRGLTWVLAWTVVGSLIPGLGLLAAGRRRIGALVLGIAVVGLAGLAVWALRGDILRRGVSFAVDPHRLLVLAIVAVGTGVLWALIVVLTGTQLHRRVPLARNQKIVGWLVVGALVAGIGVPTYAVTDYALVQRDLVLSVFDSAGDVDADADIVKPAAVEEDPWAGTERINVLLIGSDAGADREGIRPDTLIVASIQPSSGNTVLFSLPRNLERVPFRKDSPGAEAWPDGYQCADESCLLNAVWTWALDAPGYAKYENPGLKATEDAVTGVTGLKIDTYAMLNLKGFQDLIDAIGGVTLNVDERLPIGGNSERPDETIGYIEPGDNQHMNGWRALWFARSRWSTSDYDRMRRQRCVIAAVTDQADPVTVARNFPKIAKALKDNMSTGIPQSDIQAWVELATRVQGAEVTSLPFTDDVVADRTDPDYDLIHRQVTKAIEKSEKAAVSATATPSASASASATSSPTGSPADGATSGATSGSTPGSTLTTSPAPTVSSSAAVTTKKKSKDEETTPEPTDPSSAQDVSEVC